MEREFCGDGVQAHEIGHNFSLVHAPGGCNETEPIDRDYPYARARIGPRRGWVSSRNVFVNPGGADQPGDSERRGPSLEIGPSLAFAGAVDEYGLWSIGQLDASTQPSRSPRTGGE